jgi:quinol monooxygenase YgiN
MTAPFVYITTHRVAPGRRAELEDLVAEYTEFLRTHEEGLMSHHSYLGAEGTELTLVQIHRDAESADHHLRLAAPLIHRGLEMARTVRIQVYGEPGPAVGLTLMANAEAGVELVLAPSAGPGFVREGVGT